MFGASKPFNSSRVSFGKYWGGGGTTTRDASVGGNTTRDASVGGPQLGMQAEHKSIQ